MSRVKVYCNGACPVCDAGIQGQRERMEALTRWSYNVFAKALYAWNRLQKRW